MGSPDSRTFPLLYNSRGLQVVPIFPQAYIVKRAKRERAFSLSPPRLAFLAWGDFHARLPFAR